MSQLSTDACQSLETTPENLTSIDSSKDRHTVGCLLIHWTKKDRCIGLSLVNFVTFSVHFCEFQDNTSYACLESVLLSCPLSQCYYVMEGCNKDEEKRLQRVVQHLNMSPESWVPLQDVNVHHIASLNPLEFLATSDDQAQQHYLGIRLLPFAQKALCHLVNELNLLDDPSQKGQYKVRLLLPSKFMRLDQATLTALNIFPERSGPRVSSGYSLFDFLNKCRTSMGTDLLKMWIVQPSLDLQEIAERQAIVTLFVKHSSVRHCVSFEYLRRLPNFNSLAHKFHRALLKPDALGGLCSLEDVIHLHRGLLECSALLKLLTSMDQHQDILSCEPLKQRFITPLTQILNQCKRFHQLVEYTFDPKEREEGRAIIHRQFDSRLKILLEQRDQCLNAMEQHRLKVQEALPELNPKNLSDPQTIKLIPCNSFGYLFRVKKKDQTIFQKHKSQFRQVRINKADFQFTTSQLTRLCKEYLEANQELEEQQQELATKTILAAASYYPIIETLADLLGYFDVLLAFAELSATSFRRYCCPEMVSMQENQGVIRLTNSRHPLLEIQHEMQRAQTSQESHLSNLILNSIDMQKPESYFHLITGPNMGGKSTYIRQVALICLMAQLGCHVPCDSAKLSILDTILCRVGASDDEQHGISTFYAEMIETSAILKAATSRSLILMDELGRGTSTSDGLALAYQISRYIADQIQCFTLFATHFQELSVLQHDLKGISCFKMDVKLQASQLQFLFRVLPGYADHSYGLRVAEIANMPASIVKQAEKISETLQRYTKTPSHVHHLGPLLHDIQQHLVQLNEAPVALPQQVCALKNSLKRFLEKLE